MTRTTGAEATRCWPCAVANGLVGLLVGWVPLAAALLRGDPSFVFVTAGWAVLATAYTGYRIVRLGYLPLAEPIARATGLHDRIGPGSRADPDRDDG